MSRAVANKSHEVLALVFAATLVISALVVVTWEWVPWNDLIQNQGLAAWIQGIGSVIAIGVAIAVPAWQRADERSQQIKQDERESLRRYKVVTDLAGVALRMAFHVYQNRSSLGDPAARVQRKVYDGQARELKNFFLSVGPFDLDDPNSANHVGRLRDTLTFIISNTEHSVGADPFYPPEAPIWGDALAAMSNGFRGFQAALVSRGGEAIEAHCDIAARVEACCKPMPTTWHEAPDHD